MSVQSVQVYPTRVQAVRRETMDSTDKNNTLRHLYTLSEMPAERLRQITMLARKESLELPLDQGHTPDAFEPDGYPGFRLRFYAGQPGQSDAIRALGGAFSDARLNDDFCYLVTEQDYSDDAAKSGPFIVERSFLRE